MKKKWIIIFSLIFTVSGISLLVFNLNITPAEAEVAVSARILSVCGNDILEDGEQCDTSKLGGQTCVTRGYIGGTLACYPPGPANECSFNTSACTSPAPPPSGGGGGGGGASTPSTTVVLQGKAYPSASITVLIDGKTGTIAKADSGANFKITLTTLNAGIYTFGLWAEDKEGRRSITFSFTVTIASGMTTTIGEIFLPPTIELSKANIVPGEMLDIFGQTAPESSITISVQSDEEIVKKTTAQEDGDWKYSFHTAVLGEGSHMIRAKAEDEAGLISSFSKVLGFYVGKYTAAQISPRADFNKDDKTNLVDFSIMLYWWGKYNPNIDQNQNGIVDLPDFSILMYWWSG